MRKSIYELTVMVFGNFGHVCSETFAQLKGLLVLEIWRIRKSVFQLSGEMIQRTGQQNTFCAHESDLRSNKHCLSIRENKA